MCGRAEDDLHVYPFSLITARRVQVKMSQRALDAYRKGKAYRKAVDLARVAFATQVYICVCVRKSESLCEVLALLA